MRKSPLPGIFLICIFFMIVMLGFIHPVNAVDHYTQPTLLWKSSSLSKNVVADVAISSNGQYTLVGTFSNDKQVYLFDQYGKLMWKNTVGAGIANVAITPDGEYGVVSAGNKSWFLVNTLEPAENTVNLFNRQGNLLWKYNTGECMGLVAISANGQYIVFGDGAWSDTSVTLLNREKVILWKYNTDENIKAVAISSDGQYVVIGLTDGTILLLNHEGKQLWEYNTMGITRMGIAISADDQHIAISEQSTKGAIIHHLNKNGQLIWKYNTDVGMLDIAISPDGNYIAAGSNDLYLFDRNGKLSGKYVTGTGGAIKKIVVSSNNLYVAMGNWDGSVSMYSSGNQEIIPDTSLPATATMEYNETITERSKQRGFLQQLIDSILRFLGLK